jgi:hypothetical protein
MEIPVSDAQRGATRILILVVVLILSALVGWYWLRAPVAATAAGPSTAAAAPAGTADVTPTGQPAASFAEGLPVRVRRPAQPPAASTSAVTPLAELPPLPPAEQPLADAYEVLEKRARAGDVQAASRLAQDALCCAGMDMAASALDYFNNRAPQNTDRQQVVQQAAMRAVAEDNLLKLRGYCGKSPMQRPPQLFDLALRAAELGDPVMTMELLGGRRLMGMLQSQAVAEYERVGRYRDRALDLITRQVQQGNLDAVRLLAAAHANPDLHSTLGGLLERDPQAVLVYDLLYLRAGGQAYRGRFNGFVERMRQQPALLSGVDFPAAEQQAEQLYQQYFAGRTPSETGQPRLAMLEPDDGWSAPPASLARMRTCPAQPFSMNMPMPAAPRASGPAP